MAHDTTDSARKRKPDSVKIKIKGAWTAIPNKLLLDQRLSRDARLLGCLIFLHAGNSGRAFPSQEKMAEELGCVRRSIIRWLEELQATGWVEWRQTLRNNEYTLRDPDEPEELAADSSLNKALIGVTPVSHHVIPESHGDATERSLPVTQESHSDVIPRSAPMTQESHSSLLDSLGSDSWNKESSSSDTTPTHHPDDGNDDPVVAFLREAGVTAAQEFQGLDLSAVQERVARLQRDPNCRPGAIVKSLRASPPRPTPAMGSPAYIDQLNAKYGDLFRSGSDMSGLLPEDEEQQVGEDRPPGARSRK